MAKLNWDDVGLVVFVACVICVIVYVFLFYGDTAIVVSGAVVEKIAPHNGYGRNVHILKVDIGGERYAWITTSKRVWNAVMVGGSYEFGGPRQGDSYNSVKALENDLR